MGVIVVTLGAAILAVPTAASASAADDVRNCLEKFHSTNSALVQYKYDSCGGRSIRSRIVLSGAVDEACHTLTYGHEYRDTWSFGSYDGVKAC
ncbi:hypothetical protein [Saccharothrix syringae]|uniref:Uncharacterized protein n=1 Tax=Saccharothrix syringae TaxID=103733 RepID=A0A5Q0GY27_SACSY|nr:hypothetical protein [Saccharothrix syringae]QFZ18394.1 hypothetical protein EKG83_13675 [Saccharothrix syringae]